MGYSINTEDYHYIEWYDWYPKRGEKGTFRVAELYDVKNDPTETNNLAVDDKYKEAMSGLSGLLAKGWRNALPKS